METFDIFSVIIGFVTALLGIAYPIIIQITIEDKYSSETILDLFEYNKWNLTFKYSLYTSITFIGIYLLEIPRITDFKVDFTNTFIENLAFIILSFSTISLIYSFFRLMNVIKTFNRTSSLRDYLIKKDNEKTDDSSFIYFDALSDITYWAIQKQDTKIAKELSRYFYRVFYNYRSDNLEIQKDSGIIYPDRYYWLVYGIIQKIIGLEKNSLLTLENRTVSGIWLLGEFQKSKISEKTYTWLWNNLSLIIENNKSNLSFQYWKTAHQYIQFNLDYIPQDFEYDETLKKHIINNKKEIKEREKERERFLEFHYALGGLILYKKDINLIKKIFNYTTSTPPSRPLLPMNMTEVFNKFFKFFDPYERHFTWISEKYSFPEMESVSDLRTINLLICKYIGVLYLRQFNINTYYTYQKPTEKPNIPSEISEKRLWLENIKYFNNIVFELMEEKIPEKLGFKKMNYLSLIEEFSIVLKEDFELSLKNVKIEKSKVEFFIESSKGIIKKTFDEFSKIFSSSKFIKKEDTDDYLIDGLSNVTEKGAYYENGISYLNYDSFLAEGVVKKIRERIINSFNYNLSKKYILNQEDVFKAIEKLDLNDNHIIVGFGFSILFYIDRLQVPNLSKNRFKNTELILIPYNTHNVINSIFILRKTDLPELTFEKIKKEYRELNELETIIEKYKVYASVIDLNVNDKKREELLKEEEYSDEDKLKKSVFQNISFTSKLSWRKEFKIIKIQVRNNWDNLEGLNTLNDIEKY